MSKKYKRMWLYEVHLGTRRKPTQYWGAYYSRKDALKALAEECKEKGFVIRRSFARE